MQTKPPSLLEPFSQQFQLAEGVMCDPQEHIVRRASDMRGYYADGALDALIVAQGDPPHYETFEAPVPEEPGQVKYCISKLYPGTVGEECLITKGHYHAVPATAEVYLCLRGRGGMMMKTAGGECRWEEFIPGRLVYVPPYWCAPFDQHGRRTARFVMSLPRRRRTQLWRHQDERIPQTRLPPLGQDFHRVGNCRLSLRESSATFAERKATKSSAAFAERKATIRHFR